MVVITGIFMGIVEVHLYLQLILVYHKIVTWFETEIQTSETSIGNVVDFEWFSPGATPNK